MATRKAVEKPVTCRIRLNAYVDAGTGLTVEQQRVWLDQARAKLTDAILEAVLEADDFFRMAAVVATDDGLVVQADGPLDIEGIVGAKLGRNAAYAEVYPMTSADRATYSGGVRWGEWSAVHHLARHDADGRNPAAWPSDFRDDDHLPLLSAAIRQAISAR